jgi:hypothetical protein
MHVADVPHETHTSHVNEREGFGPGYDVLVQVCCFFDSVWGTTPRPSCIIKTMSSRGGYCKDTEVHTNRVGYIFQLRENYIL